MPRVRLLAGAALVLVLAALLIWLLVRTSGSTGDPEPAAAGEPSDRTEEVVDSTDEVEEEEPELVVPTPDTSGRDFERIVHEINEFRNWLYQNPDPELLDIIYHPDCDCYEEARAVLERMARDGLRLDGPWIAIERIELVENFPAVARVEVSLTRHEVSVVDDSGQSVETLDRHEPALQSVSLVQAAAGGWVIRTIS